MKKTLLLVIICLLLLPSAFASYFQDWHKWLHVPPEYSEMPDLLYFFILPFLAVFAIVWGILTKINIFPSFEKKKIAVEANRIKVRPSKARAIFL